MFEEKRLESLVRKPARTLAGDVKEPNRRLYKHCIKYMYKAEPE